MTGRKQKNRTEKTGEGRQGLKFFRSLFKNALDFTSVLDREGNFLFQSASIKAFLGYRENELKGKNVFDFIHPDDLQEIRNAFSELTKVPGRVVSREFRFRHKNGTYRWIESTGLNLLDDPHVRGIVVNSRDVDDRRRAEDLLRESEKKYRTLAEASMDMIFIVDRNDRVVYVNKSAADFFELRPEDIMGRLRAELFPKELAEKQRRNIERVLNSGKCEQIEGYIEFKGKKLFITTWLVPLKNDYGEIDSVMGVSRDITEIKKLEEKIKKEQQFTDLLIESLPGIFYFFDENLKFLRWNRNIESITKYLPEEIEKMDVFDFIHPEDRDKVYEKIQIVWNQGFATVEARVRTKDGLSIPFIFTGTRFREDNKNYILGVGLDISDLKKAEKRLIDREAFFRALIQNTHEIFTIINEKGEMIFQSSAIEKIMGFKPEELTGENAFKYVHPDDARILMEAIRDVLEEPGKTVTRQMRMMHKDGSWRYIESTGYNLLHEPAIRGIVINSRDITEQKEIENALMESEAKFRGLVERSLVGVYIIQDGFFPYVNPRLAEIFGYTQDEIIGKVPVLDLVAEEDRELVSENIRKRINRETESINYQFRGRKKDGSTFFVEVFGTRTQFRGKPAVIGTLLDITERRRFQEQLFQAQKLEAVGRLAGGIAHDFNNLLTLIMLHSEMILKQSGEKDFVETSIREIYESAVRASKLTSQLLSFARRQIIEPVVFNVNAFIKGITNMLKSLTGEHIKVNVFLEDNVSAIKVDPAQFEHSIINLVLNARDAMPRGGELTIETKNVGLDAEYCRTHPEVVPGEYVMLAISDTGIGMDEETKAKIFEPFFTTKKDGKGTGLGLASVYGFVKQSGGHIWVYSEINKGTTFKIYLPAYKEKGEEIKITKEKPEGLHGTETILFAEDEPSIRALLCKILSSYGYRVMEAKDGIDALERAEKFGGKIDLLLTDLVMPGMGGKELYERLKNVRPDIKVLFISGYTDNVVVHNFVVDKNCNFLQKPFKPEVLLKKIREILG